MGIIITKEHSLFMVETNKGLVQVPKEEKWSEDLVKVSLNRNKIQEIPSGMAPMTPNLTVLMLNDNPLKEIPDSFFVHMKALTVLDLSRTSVERVPERVSDLENLRGLLLARCCRLTYVPSVAKLTKLRTLDLWGSWELKVAPSGLERLKCIEKVSYIPWDVSNVIGFNEVMQSLTSLSHYKFWICDSTFCGTFDEYGIFFEYQKAVWIREGEFGEDKCSWLVPNTLELLVIENCDMKGRCLGDVFQSLGEATGLKHMRLEYCRGLESISGTQQGATVLCGTSQPEVLELRELPDLRSIAKLGVPHSFTHLRELCIIECPKLKVVLPMTCNNQLHFPNLESIEVKECEEVEEIFGSNKVIKSSPIHSLSLSLPKFKKLELIYVPKIKVIFPFTEELHFPNLESIKVEGCEDLEEVFESNKATPSSPILSLSLPKLKKLKFEDVPKIKVIFPFTEELYFPNLESIKMIACEEWKEIYESNKATPSSPILSLSLPQLKKLKLEDVPKIKVIFPFTKELHFPNLESIEVKRCELEEIFESNKATPSSPILSLSLPNLKNLQIIDEPKIKVIFPFTEELHVSNLERIEVTACKKVKEIFESSKATSRNLLLALPNLQSLELYNLLNLRSICKGMLLDIPKLRILDLYGCWKLKGAHKGLERMKCVEELSYMPWDVTDMIGFNKVIQSLTSLSHYRFLIQDPTLYKSFGYWKGFSRYEKAVCIRGGEFGEDTSSFLLPTTLECLVILECDMEGRCLGDILPSLGEVTGLKEMVFIKCRGLDYVVGSSGTRQGSWSSYPELDYLFLIELPDLRSIVKVGGPHSFSYLKYLYIRGCPKLKAVLPMTSTNLLHLPYLERIEVKNCEEVEEIFGSNKGILSSPVLSLSLPFLNLKELKLEDLPKIKVIFPFTKELHLPNLESIEVRRCDEVEEIFESNTAILTSNPSLSIPNLKKFVISDLPKLRSIYKGLLLSGSFPQLH